MAKYTVSFKVETEFHYQSNNNRNLSDAEVLEIELNDLIKTIVLPTLDLTLVPLTFTVKKARG